MGRRKTLAKRIETERITLSSSTLPSTASSSLLPFLSSPSAAKAGTSPKYSLRVTYVRSSNGGKSLLGRAQGQDSRPYEDFFDEEGTLDQERFGKWVGGVVERTMEAS